MEAKISFRVLIQPAVAVLLAGLIPAVAPGDDGGAAKATPVGSEFQVNSYTTSSQSTPAVAVDANGNFVVVWQSYGSGGTDSTYRSVQGQRYASDGSPLGGEFQVNTYTTSHQQSPAVAVAADGDFVVVWQSADSEGSIQGQRYASDGSLVGGKFQVNSNSYTSYYPQSPAVAVAADGDFVVVWHSYSYDSFLSTNIQGQRYASDGSPLGGEFQVNSHTTYYQELPAVAVAADGDFVVVWQNWQLVFGSIQGQRYASDGSPLGGEFRVNSDPPSFNSFQGFPAVAMDADGDFVVMWHSSGSSGTDSSSYGIQGQRYASDGSALGGQFQVNSYTTSNQVFPTAAVDADGDFVVVWSSYGSSGTDSSSYSIQGQRYTSDGSPLSSEFQINSYTTSSQSLPTMAVDADGDFVVVWSSYGSEGTDSSSWSIQGQRFTAAGAVAGCSSSSTHLCLNQRRFQVEVDWRDFDGNTGSGQVVPFGSDDSGLFWFFDPDNWEMLVKVLDGCGINNHFWVFSAATTNVEYTLRVTDTETGAVKEYFNPLGTAAAAITDTGAFATCPGQAGGAMAYDRVELTAPPSTVLVQELEPSVFRKGSACVAGSSILCLNQDRFRVEVDWMDFQGGTGSGQVVPFGSDDSGLFWFFSADNWEMLVKVLNGCGINSHFWVFAAATTNVEYTLRVTDTETGTVMEYFNPLGSAATAITDTGAFGICP